MSRHRMQDRVRGARKKSVLGVVRSIALQDSRTDLDGLRARIIEDRRRAGMQVQAELRMEALLREQIAARLAARSATSAGWYDAALRWHPAEDAARATA